MSKIHEQEQEPPL